MVLPDIEPQGFIQHVRDIEAAGLRGAWTYDHLSWRDMRDGPWHASVPLLAAAGTATTTVRLGFLVASPNFRHPVPFAKDVMTLDHLAHGRVDLGIGAGGTGADATVLGAEPLTPAQRMARFDAFVRCLDTLLRNPATTDRNGDYDAVDARMIPGCVQVPRVPLTIAAAGPRGLALAAELADGWVSYGPPAGAAGDAATTSPAEAWYGGLAHQSQVLTDACRAIGRDPATIRRVALVGLLDVELASDLGAVVDRTEQLGFDELAIHWPRSDGRGVTEAQVRALLARAGG